VQSELIVRFVVPSNAEQQAVLVIAVIESLESFFQVFSSTWRILILMNSVSSIRLGLMYSEQSDGAVSSFF